MARAEILTLPEVAELLRVAPKTVYTLAQRAELPGFKVGGQWRFSRAAIDAWIESRTTSGRRGRPGGGSARTGPGSRRGIAPSRSR